MDSVTIVVIFCIVFSTMTSALSFIVVTIILKRTEKIMATGATAAQALADLQAVAGTISNQLTSLQTADEALKTAIDTLVAAQASGGVQPADVEAVVASLQQASLAIGSITSAVQAQTSEATGTPAPPTPSTPKTAA